MRPLLSITFPQGFRISKNIGLPTSGSGGKKTVKRYLKSEQTNRQTDIHTNIWTFRLIESIGPEGLCFEKLLIQETTLMYCQGVGNSAHVQAASAATNV